RSTKDGIGLSAGHHTVKFNPMDMRPGQRDSPLILVQLRLSGQEIPSLIDLALSAPAGTFATVDRIDIECKGLPAQVCDIDISTETNDEIQEILRDTSHHPPHGYESRHIAIKLVELFSAHIVYVPTF